jgi:Protein of unknown function (DUF3017)
MQREGRRRSRPASRHLARPAAARGKRAVRGAQLPYLFVLACGASGIVLIWLGGGNAVKRGTLAVAGAMFVAALARLALPESRAGMLASRKRFTDVVTLVALGAGLLAAGLLLPAAS